MSQQLPKQRFARRFIELKPGDVIEALCELRVGPTGEFEFACVSERADGLNFAIWVEGEGTPEGGDWFELEWSTEADSYGYRPDRPLT